MGDVEVCAAADRNVELAVGHFARYGDGAVSSRRAGTLLVASATDFIGAFHNTAFRLTPDTDPRRVMDEARAFGSAHGEQYDDMAIASHIFGIECNEMLKWIKFSRAEHCRADKTARAA